MVNASLNWASFYGIGLIIFSAVLFSLQFSKHKQELARDYDVFFAAAGLLSGGIFTLQGWRLDPILTLGCFLLVGSTVFLGYQIIRYRRFLYLSRDYERLYLEQKDYIASRETEWDKKNIVQQPTKILVKCSYCGAPVN